MNKDNRNNEQIYGRNDMIMLDQSNKIYGSLGIADNYVMKTEEGTRLVLRNPKSGRFGDVLTEFNIYGKSSQNKTTGKNLLKYPYIETTKTSSGIMFMDNKDGSINVSGTATDTAYYNLYSNMDGKRLTLASGTYKLIVKGKSKCDVIVSNDVSTAVSAGTFTITDGNNEIYCYIAINKGLTVDETIYPMIQLASNTDESYEPYTGGIPSPNPDYPQEIKSVVSPVIKVSNGDGTESQTVQLPYTLNAIPVASGGNVTIDGQQYIADRVVEKDGVFGIERNIATDVPVLTEKLRETADAKGRFLQEYAFKKTFIPLYAPLVNIGYGKVLGVAAGENDKWIFGLNKSNIYITPPKDLNYTSNDVLNALKDLNIKVYGALSVSIFEPLPEDIQSKLRALSTNYPVTIIENNYNTWMKATYKSIESV